MTNAISRFRNWQGLPCPGMQGSAPGSEAAARAALSEAQCLGAFRTRRPVCGPHSRLPPPECLLTALRQGTRQPAAAEQNVRTVPGKIRVQVLSSHPLPCAHGQQMIKTLPPALPPGPGEAQNTKCQRPAPSPKRSGWHGCRTKASTAADSTLTFRCCFTLTNPAPWDLPRSEPQAPLLRPLGGGEAA